MNMNPLGLLFVSQTPTYNHPTKSGWEEHLDIHDKTVATFVVIFLINIVFFGLSFVFGDIWWARLIGLVFAVSTLWNGAHVWMSYADWDPAVYTTKKRLTAVAWILMLAYAIYLALPLCKIISMSGT